MEGLNSNIKYKNIKGDGCPYKQNKSFDLKFQFYKY